MRDTPSGGRGKTWDENGAMPEAGPIPGPRARGAVSKKDQLLEVSTAPVQKGDLGHDHGG
jgi:hypothetical protein